MNKYVRIPTGEVFITNEFDDIINKLGVKSSDNILDLLEEGDLVRIEYFSLRYNKRITRLFEVESISEDRYYISINNAHMQFLICDNEYLDKEFNPIVKSIIPREKLYNIECDLTSTNKQIYTRKLDE